MSHRRAARCAAEYPRSSIPELVELRTRAENVLDGHAHFVNLRSHVWNDTSRMGR